MRTAVETTKELNQCIFEAKDPSTKPERLHELSLKSNTEILRWVIQNPNVPVNTALGMVELYPAEFLKNPMLILWLLEDPGFWVKLSKASCIALVTGAWRELLAMSFESLAYFTQHKDPTVRAALAGIRGLPPEFYALLGAEDQPRQARYAIAENPGCTPEVLRLLATVKDKWILGRVAQNPASPTDVLWAMITHPQEWVYGCALNHPNCTDAMRDYVKAHHSIK